MTAGLPAYANFLNLKTMHELNLNSTLPLNDGHPIPQLGLGVFQMNDAAVCSRAVRAALDCGYRHIDTAAIYGNEEAVGRAVADSGVPREDVYITTKCWVTDFGRKATRTACETSLRKLETEYIDLYLLHWPDDATMLEAWETLVALRGEGRCRSIGVSNFTERRLEEAFLRHTDVVPAVNQVEVHPFWTREGLRDYCRARGTVIQSYCPLAKAERFTHPVLVETARDVGRSAAQVMVRWHLQHGLVPIPKSQHPERVQANADVFDFALSEGQMQRLDELNQDASITSWRPNGGKGWY